MTRARAATYCAGQLLAAAAVLVVCFPPRLLAAGGAPAMTVHVGVILGLATGLGKKSLLSLAMALEDLYAAHPSFVTRVRLHIRDSDRDVVTAASAAMQRIGLLNF